MGRGEPGAALALAILALTVVGLVATAATFVGVQEMRLGRTALGSETALAAAEASAAKVVSDWDITRYASLGEFESAPAFQSGGEPVGIVSVTRLAGPFYLIRSEGTAPGGTARQRIGVILRAEEVVLPVAAALVIRGAPPDGALVSTPDAPPPTWGCWSSPPAVTRPLGDAAFDRFFDGLFAHLAPRARWALEAGRYTGIESRGRGPTCAVADRRNWGDPLHPAGLCGAYFPVIRGSGTLEVAAGSGQGILLVDGDLTVGQGFRFYGLVLVRGTVRIVSGGAVVGQVVAHEAIIDSRGPAARPAVAYSSCVVARALAASGRVRPLPERGWTHLP